MVTTLINTLGGINGEWSGLRRSSGRAFLSAVCAFGMTLGLALILAFALAPPAGAVVTKIGGHFYGVTPLAGVNAASIPGNKVVGSSNSGSANSGAANSLRSANNFDSTGNLTYNGGPVMHGFRTYAIYWDPGGAFSSVTDRKSVV